MKVFHFDPAAYRRIRLPRLLLVLFLSLGVDGVLLITWLTGVSPDAQFFWNVGFAFLGLVNFLCGKVLALYEYFRIKRLRQRSYLQLDKNQVAHYLFRSSMSHGWVENVKGTKFALDGKAEYISVDTYFIKQVKNLRQRANGSIIIEGSIEMESVNEGWEEYSADFGEAVVKTIKRHEIPAYYEEMDVIFQQISCLRSAD